VIGACWCLEPWDGVLESAIEASVVLYDRLSAPMEKKKKYIKSLGKALLDQRLWR
jgi:hypothetical protein